MFSNVPANTARVPNINVEAKQRLIVATLHFAQTERIDTEQKRGGRYGYNWYVPMRWGAATNPKPPTLMSSSGRRTNTASRTAKASRPTNTPWATSPSPLPPMAHSPPCCQSETTEKQIRYVRVWVQVLLQVLAPRHCIAFWRSRFSL